MEERPRTKMKNNEVEFGWKRTNSEDSTATRKTIEAEKDNGCKRGYYRCGSFGTGDYHEFIVKDNNKIRE